VPVRLNVADNKFTNFSFYQSKQLSFVKNLLLLIALAMPLTLIAYNRADDPKPPVTVATIDFGKLLAASIPKNGGNAEKAKSGLPARPSPAQIKAALDAFDLDFSGQLSSMELQQTLNQANVKFTEAQANQLIKMFDANNSGMMEFNEFERHISEALKHVK